MPTTEASNAGANPDYFISYTAKDRPWAEWIAWVIEEQSQRAVIQAWDFRAASNFVLKMQEATRATRTLAVLTPDYFESTFTEPEWAAAFAHDPSSKEGKLVGVRVADFQPPGLFTAIVYIDLVGLDEKTAEQRLVDGLQTGRGKPTKRPTFPGAAASKPPFPGASAPAIASTATNPTLHNVPAAPHTFTGRTQELDVLHERIQSQTAAAVIGLHGLQGQGGVGKTALVLKLAEQLRDRFPDGQIFLDLQGYSPDRSPLPPAAFLTFVLQTLHPEARLPEDPATLGQIYRETLRGRKVLLIADNVAPQPGLENLLPPSGSLLLLTSRETLDLAGFDPVRIGELSAPDAYALLRRVCPRLQSEPDDALQPLAKRSGYLALALETNARTLNLNRLLTVPALCARLEGERALLEPVRAAYQVSYEHLTDDTLRHAWLTLGIFTANFDLRAAAAVLNVNEEAARDLLGKLDASSLITFDEQTGRFHLHDLARAFCDRQLDDNTRDTARFRHAAHYRDVGAEADDLYKKGGDHVVRGLALFDKERAHLEAALAWLQPHPDEEAAKLLVSLINSVAYVGDLRFHPRQLIGWLEAQRAAAKIAKDRKSEGNALGSLGLAYADLGDARKAIDFYEQQLVIAREIGDRRDEGAALNNLGLAYAALGDARKAIAFYEQDLAIAREIGDRRGESAALGNLGLAYADLGDARKAIDFYEQQLVIVREIGDRRGEGNALGNLGLAYADLGDARKAIDFYEQQLVIAREIGDRRGEGNALGNLGIAYADLGDARKAIDFYEQQLVIVREIGDRRGEGNALGNLGSAYAALGDARKAIDFYEQRLAIAREIGDRRGEGSALGNLGNAYAALGDARRAIDFYEQRLAIAREIGDRRGEGNALWNSALQYRELGKNPEAIARAEAALEIFEAIEHPHRDMVHTTLANWRTTIA